jgi:hypothetical protein
VMEQAGGGIARREGECVWERPLRLKLAFLCMAAVAGESGDMRAATEDILSFCRNLSGAEDKGA